MHRVVPDGAGGVYAIRTSGPNGYWGRIHHLTADGANAPGWPDTGAVYSDVISDEFVIDATPDGQGGVIVAWDDQRNAPPNHDPFTLYGDIYAQHYRFDGTRAPGWPAGGLPVCTVPGAHWNARLCSDGAGGALITWANLSPPTPPSEGLQHVRADGTIDPLWPAGGLQIGNAASLGVNPKIVPDGSGGAYLAWVSDQQSLLTEYAWAQHILADGTPAPGWDVFPTQLSYPVHLAGYQIDIAQSGHDAVVTWESLDASGCWAQRLVDDRVVATRAALRHVERTAQAVTLQWWGSGAGTLDARVQRSTDAVTWTTLGPASTSSADELAYVDGTTVPTQRYAYRLASAGAEPLSEPAWVDPVPARGFAIGAVSPNPLARGTLRVHYSLERSGPGAIELLDLAGRRIAARDIGREAAGEGEALFPESAGLSAGVYWARLRQGARSSAVRFAVVEH